MSTAPAGRFAAVLGRRDVAPLVAATMIGRLPMGMMPLGLVLLLRGQHRSYAVAGAVVAAESLGEAVANPLLGRAVDRFGVRRVLLPLAFGFAACLGGAVAWIRAGEPLAGAVVLSALAGGALPPLGACMRARWPRLVDAEHLRSAAYAFEATVQELAFVVGPLLVAVLASALSPAAALGSAAAGGLLGAAAFAACVPAGERARAGPPPRGGALRSIGVRTVLLTSIGLGLSFGAFEVSMPAFAERHGSRALAGVIVGAFALGSLLGGVAAARRPPRRGQRRRYLLALLALGLALLPLLVASSIPAMTVLALVAGAPIAPGFAAAYSLLDQLAVRGTATETFAWVGTTVLGGAGAGTAIGGVLVRADGYRAALVLSLAGVAVAALLALARRDTLSGEPVPATPERLARAAAGD